MKESIQTRNAKVARRTRRVRVKLTGTSARPRMSVNISNRHLVVQFIDDMARKTLLASSDALLGKKLSHITVAAAAELGEKVAALAKEKGIESVIFDRGSRAYHGRMKAFADGARTGGLIV